jgi:hypothetical protein
VHPPPAGHTQLSRVNPTAGGQRQSLTDEGRLTLHQEVPNARAVCHPALSAGGAGPVATG